MVAAAGQKAAEKAALASGSEAAHTGETDDYYEEVNLASGSEAAHTGENDDYYDTT